MSTLRTFATRLGRPDAINWLSAVSIVIFQTVASLITSGVDFEERLPLFVGVRLVSLTAMVGVLALGKWVLTTTAGRWWGAVVTLVTFLVGLAVSTALFDVLLVVSGLTEQSFLLRRVLLSLGGGTVILTMVAFVMTTAREYAGANQSLYGAIRDVEALREGTSTRIQQRRDDLMGTIQNLINEQISTATLSGEKADTVMRNLIDDVIRPLSHALGKQTGTTESEPVVTQAAIPWRQVVRGTLTGNPYSLIAFPVAIGLVVTTFLAMSFGFLGVAVTAVLFLLALGLNALFRAFWRALPVASPVGVRLVVFTLSLIPFFWLTVWFVNATTGFDLAVSTVRLVSWGVIVLATWWVAALTSSVFRQLKGTNRELGAALAQLKTELATLNGADHRLRRNISRVLHGPVQEAVSSSLRRLHSDPSLIDDPETLHTLRERIESALGTLDVDAKTPVDLIGELEDLREVWEGSVTIETTLASHTREVLDRHPEATHLVLELIREACHNAIKHGDARHIRIHVSVDRDTRLVALTVSNDGALPPADARPGMGSALFDDLTVSWQTYVGADGFAVAGTLPLISR